MEITAIGGVVLVLVLLLWYLSTTAARLDRLNKRVEASSHSLEMQLLRRVNLAMELAGSGALEPSSSALVADAAHRVRIAPQDLSPPRAVAESTLTSVLSAVFADPADVAALRAAGGSELADDLDMVTRRVAMSRRFLNDGVRANRDVRSKRAVRYFRLAGTSTVPLTFEFDDSTPAGFGVR